MSSAVQLPDAGLLVQQLTQAITPRLTAHSALVGIHSGGAWIAQKLHQQLGEKIPLGILDISFYRDDFSQTGLHPEVKPSDIPFDVAGSDIILVDDVLHTGRTVRAAMNELFDYGRPASITLVVLIDRGGRELPISAQITGQTLTLAPLQNIQLERNAAGRLSLSLHEVQP